VWGSLESVKSGRLSSFDGGVVSELSVLGSVGGAVCSVVSTVIKGESCHDICAVSSDQLVISSPEWLRQGGLSVSGIHTAVCIRLWAVVPLRDVPLLLGLLVQSGQLVVVVVVVA
jgi:hypothetical protein